MNSFKDPRPSLIDRILRSFKRGETLSDQIGSEVPIGPPRWRDVVESIDRDMRISATSKCPAVPERLRSVSTEHPVNGLLLRDVSEALSEGTTSVLTFQIDDHAMTWLGGCQARLLSPVSEIELVRLFVGGMGDAGRSIIHPRIPIPIHLYNLISFDCPLFQQLHCDVRRPRSKVDPFRQAPTLVDADVSLLLYSDMEFHIP